MKLRGGINIRNINLVRLKKCMLKAEKGNDITIGFLGGSITQGSLSSTPENCYAFLVYDWWRKSFPKSEISYVNAGIGGTDSYFGVARAVSDLLMYQPDVVIIDFSVNDKDSDFFMETYEGVIRKILSWNSNPAILLLHNVFYDTGKSAEEKHGEVGKWYELPGISIRDTIYRQIEKGIIKREEITPDGLHPNDKGHRYVADEIISFLNQVKDRKLNDEEYIIPRPLTQNSFEKAKRLTIREDNPELIGFRADAGEKKGHLDFFKNGWIGKKAGDKIIFKIEAASIGVQYRKTIKRPSLRARLVLDNDISTAKILDGNFEEDWGDCLYLENVLREDTKKKHIVEIEIMDDGKNVVTPFYLMSLIIT